MGGGEEGMLTTGLREGPTAKSVMVTVDGGRAKVAARTGGAVHRETVRMGGGRAAAAAGWNREERGGR